MITTFDELKPKSGDIMISTRNNNHWHFYPKKTHLNDVAKNVATIIGGSVPTSFVDFGGVSAYHLQDETDNSYIDNPDQIEKGNDSWIYSFVPTNNKFKEVSDMKASAIAAGFAGIIILTKKDGDRGKADFLNALLGALPNNADITYYEDTADILDSLTESANGKKVKKVWVQPPKESEHHNKVPNSDEIIRYSVEQYLDEILEKK
jgi:hypothetical protein